MKVFFKNMINGYTGANDDYVMYYNRKLDCVIMRERPKYKKHTGQSSFKKIMANLGKIKPSQAYKDDADAYILQYNKSPEHKCYKLITWNNLFMKVMFNMANQDPTIDLASITKEQIYNENLPCQSVFHCIEAGLLPKVRNYERLTSPM